MPLTRNLTRLHARSRITALPVATPASLAARWALPLALATMLAVQGLPARAASSASSASSEASSASVGSVSTSFGKSSESSTGDRRAAAGDWRIVAVAPMAGSDGRTQVTLVAATTGSDVAAAQVELLLPAATAANAGLAAGQLIRATARPYGLEFARADAREPFFLVLEDDVYRELQTRRVGA